MILHKLQIFWCSKSPITHLFHFRCNCDAGICNIFWRNKSFDLSDVVDIENFVSFPECPFVMNILKLYESLVKSSSPSDLRPCVSPIKANPKFCSKIVEISCLQYLFPFYLFVELAPELSAIASYFCMRVHECVCVCELTPTSSTIQLQVRREKKHAKCGFQTASIPA